MPIVFHVPPTYFVDGNGVQWQVACDDNGIVTTSVVTGALAVPSISINDITALQTWSMTVGIDGLINIFPIAYNPLSPPQIQINSVPKGFLFVIKFDNGVMETSPFCKGAPLIGTLYIQNWNNIAWSQPSGPGTKVFPAQNDGPMLAYPVPGQFISEAGEALWRAGCGHGFDEYQIFRDYDDCTGLSVAVQTCPICTYIVRVYEPYEVIFDPIQHYILV